MARKGGKPSAKRITASIKAGIPRGLAILAEYDRVGKLPAKYKKFNVTKRSK